MPTRSRRRALLAAGALALLAGAPAPLRAQPALLDSLRPAVEGAVARGEWAVLDGAAARLRTAIRGAAMRDAWTHYDLAYVLHRRASALIIAERAGEAKPLLEEADRMLVRAIELGAGPSATALRGAVSGQLAGAGGMMNAMRMGPRAFKLLDEAVAAAPRDPRVAFLNGLTRLNAPAAFGGGPAKGEPEFRRAIALFAQDAARSPAPTWGRADAHIWLAIALEKQGKRAEARAELLKALDVSPGHAWVTRELLPKLDAAR